MINPEKLLGGLLRGSARGSGRGLGGLVTSGVAMGALGVAMEAVEHFLGKPTEASHAGPTAGAPTMSGPPPPPPPVTGKPPASPPPPPMASSQETTETDGRSDAVLLIRAMIAAANADGIIDEKERDNILKQLEIVALSPEEHTFIVKELLSPADLDAIVEGVDAPELARQVYAVSLMAIEVDTDREREYMENLARRLKLDDAAIEQIQNGMGLKLS